MLKVKQRVVVTEVRNYERVFQTKKDLVAFLEENLPSGGKYPKPLHKMSEKELVLAYELHCTFMPLDNMNLKPRHKHCEITSRDKIELEHIHGLDIQWYETAMLYSHGGDSDIKGSQHLAKIFIDKTEIRLEIIYSDDLRVNRSGNIIKNPRNVHMRDHWFSLDPWACSTMTLDEIKEKLEAELLRSI